MIVVIIIVSIIITIIFIFINGLNGDKSIYHVRRKSTPILFIVSFLLAISKSFIPKDVYKRQALESIHPPYLFLNGVSLINNGIEKDIIEPHSKGSLLSVLKSEARGNLLVEKKDIPSNS